MKIKPNLNSKLLVFSLSGVCLTTSMSDWAKAGLSPSAAWHKGTG